MNRNEKSIGKREVILIAVVSAAAVFLCLINQFLLSAPAAWVEVSVVDTNSNKTVLERFDLNDTIDHVILTSPRNTGEPEGTNHLMIRDGNVWISEANCPNHDCVKKGTISQNGEMLVCIPHRLTVTIVGE